MIYWRRSQTSQIQINPGKSLKHIPLRTCIACRETKPKHELIRIVYTDESGAEIDTSGKRAGRGAYLCNSPVCWENGLKKERLERALRGKISADNRARLAELRKLL
jgi:predicted RNA-binding protein YlxR (DUF448 family)